MKMGRGSHYLPGKKDIAMIVRLLVAGLDRTRASPELVQYPPARREESPVIAAS